ncbi:MAG: SatD family protein [Methanomassiliicoccaceae archaeon]|nr:SatD family protein [Methanomassiliicoccaceae archaeon]
MINAAFILDIRNSRDMKKGERIDAQERLSDAADLANSVYGKSIRYKLDFSAGDSIQGLFTTPSSAICCYTLIRSAVHPYRIRCGIGVGDLIDMPYKDSNRMDGSSYHNARDALSSSKDGGREVLFRSEGSGDPFVNQYLMAAHTLMSKQSYKQGIINNLVFLLNPLAAPDSNGSEYYKKISGFVGMSIDQYGAGRETQGRQTLADLFEEPPVGQNGTGLSFNERTIGRSIPARIGDMLGVSSENIRQMIVKGDIEMVRSLFISASLIAEHFSNGEKTC